MNSSRDHALLVKAWRFLEFEQKKELMPSNHTTKGGELWPSLCAGAVNTKSKRMNEVREREQELNYV